ncbi:MAG: MarR family transcriptional regulator [Oligoflexales bacterium]|nr:MarR family transcriptional regulator [Oligoflexales bacterium]
MIPETLNDDLYFNLDRASLLMRRQLLNVLGEFNVSPEQWEILLFLESDIGISQSQLTAYTLKDKGNVSRIISRMVRDGWVERRSSDKDNRCVLLFLTQKGAKMRDDLIPMLAKQRNQMLVPLGSDEKGEMLFCLKKLRILLGDNSVVD